MTGGSSKPPQALPGPTAQIYTLYRCMRIVVVKRRKNKSGGHSSLGSAVAGLAAGRVMRLHEDWKQLLIEEYATLQGQDVPTPDNFSACEAKSV